MAAQAQERARGAELSPQGGTQREECEINLLELMYRLLERAKYIVLAALVGAIVAAIWTIAVLKPEYQATSKLYVLNSGDSAINLSDLQIGTCLAADYREVFSNWHVHEMVIQRLGLDYTYDELRKMISIQNPADTRILYITITCGDPDEAKLMADTYAQVAQEFIAATMETDQPNIFEEALKPAKPSASSKTRNIMLGFLLGGMLACAVFVVKFLIDDRIRSAEELEGYFGLPTLGTMPQQRAAPSRGKQPVGQSARKAVRSK